MEALNDENNILLIPSPVVIVGDIHGQLDDMMEMFLTIKDVDETYRDPSRTTQSFDHHNHRYIFLGDYVDRGYHSLNTFLYLATLKLEFPDHIFLLRGNHESRAVSNRYGLYNETILTYGHTGLFMMINEVFDLLPMAALIDQDVLCVHGGLSPDITMLEQISLFDRQVELPPVGAQADLCWSDPENVAGWRENTRGAGHLFGREETTKFTRVNRLEFVARSHQLCATGYAKYFGDDREGDKTQYRLITIWSAPDYSYRSGNKATVMKFRFPVAVSADLVPVEKSPFRIQPDPTESAVAGVYFA
jgi:diadenosine tetraphosphatase ApaH/serine/threonine PP2A family protein phosphatase